MGLDMYAIAVEKGKITEQVDFDIPEDVKQEEVHYWRKHPNMHGWMEQLYYEKGGKAESFNCVNVMLTEEDLQALEENIKGESLPETAGFFFGQSDGSEKQDDLQFIAEARQVIADGYDVFYTSWW